MIDYIPFHMIDADWLIPAILGLCAVLFLWALLGSGDAASRKIHQRAERLTSREQTQESSSEAATMLRRRKPRSASGQFGARLKNIVPNAEAIRTKLDKSGVAIDVSDFVMICAALGIAAVLFGIFVLNLPLFASAGLGLVSALWLPKTWLGMRIQRRSKKFLALFPDAIDLMVRGIKSGLPISETMKVIGEEMSDPIGNTFRGISHNLQVGMSMDEALWSAVHKLEIQEFKFFVISLSIQQETGGNLAEILQNLSTMIRKRHQLKLKIKAMSSEARASAMIIGSLPFVMAGVIYFVNTDYIMTLFTDPRGYLLLAMAGASLLTGILIIAKMVRFEI